MPSSTSATVQLGTYNPAYDTFTSVLDLNDGTNILQLTNSPELDPGEKHIQRTSNPRTDGERITTQTYGNRQVSMRMAFGKGATYATIRGLLTTFVRLCENPNLVIRYAPPSPSVSVNYSYLDVLAVTHNADKLPPLRLLNGTAKLMAVFECSPYFRGDRLYLQNLAWNPGFEQPAGGGDATTMPVVFSDAFANVNAYSVQAGGAPTTAPANTYPDFILADNPLRYHRLGETSGTSLDDLGGTGQTATLSANASGLTATGLVTGDTDKALTFVVASSHKATLPTGGNLPTGNGAFTLEALLNVAGAPAANAYIASIGANSSKTGGTLYMDTARKINCDLGGGAGLVTSAAAVSTGAVHHVACTWDGTTLTLYVDGSSTGTPTTPGANNIAASPPAFISANPTGTTGFFGGTLDEVAIYGTALSSSRISAHNTAKGGATGTVSTAMSIPASGRVQFGSSAWGPMAAWQVRFRYSSAITLLRFAPHETDESNLLRITISSGTFALAQVVAASSTTIASASITLTHEGWYWLRFTQFPAFAGNVLVPATGVNTFTADTLSIAAQIYYDDNGAIGSQVASASLTGTIPDGTVALTGKPQIAVSGAALVIGGSTSNTHTVSLFGPSSWGFVGAAGAATGTASASWDGARNELGQSGTATTGTNTTPNGPVTSFASGRIDAAPAGTLDAYWYLYSGGSPAGTSAMSIKNVADVVYAAVQVKSSGLANNATIALKYVEYNASGAATGTSGTLQTFTVSGAVQAAFGTTSAPTLSGHWTTGVGCSFFGLLVEVVDTTSGSANATVWIDNAQAWNATVTNATTMPYCELRFHNSPAQIVLSGLVGDAQAPAIFMLGTRASAFASNATVPFYVGLRDSAGAGAKLVSNVIVATILSTSSWGGVQRTDAISSTSHTMLAMGVLLSEVAGVYRLLERCQTAQIAGNLAATSVTPYTYNGQAGLFNPTAGKLKTPAFSASATMQITDAGLLSLPGPSLGALQDTTLFRAYPFLSFTDPGPGSAILGDYITLLPADEEGCLITGQIVNPSSATPVIEQVIVDGTNMQMGRNDMDVSALVLQRGTYSNDFQPERASAGAGIAGASGSFGVNLSQDSVPQVDPGIACGTNQGVNQGVGLFADQSGTVMPFLMDVEYAPLYLYPRS